MNRWEEIRALLEAEGLSHYGCARLERPATLALYEEWLEKDYGGEMDYLKRHLPMKEDPSRLFAKGQSAIVIAFDYSTHPEPVENFPLQTAKVALYARGEDYHFWIKRRLQNVITKLQDLFPDESFVSFTDSAPVLERDLAYRAGLGWVGKNTCLIHPKKGSLFLLGEIYTTLEIESAATVVPDHCGTCTRCLDICPTGAIVAPRELDARKCISYLTIEAKSPPPDELRLKTEKWFFGCDLCQTVCPWNLKWHGESIRSDARLKDDEGSRERLVEEMRLILTGSNRALLRAFEKTPLLRAGSFGLKRNALLIAAQAQLSELRPEIEKLQLHARLGELAKWTLTKINSSDLFVNG